MEKKRRKQQYEQQDLVESGQLVQPYEKSMSEANLLDEGRSNNPSKSSGEDLGETSIEEDPEVRGPNESEFFCEEAKQAPLQASDGKIIFRYSSEFIKYW